MRPFHWESEYALGVPEINRQRREIFVYLASLEGAVTGAEPTTSTGALLEKVRQPTAFHFAAEEKLLADVDFPGLVQQRVQHRLFIRRLRDAEAAAASEDGISLAEVHALQSWILGHVVGLDREYLPFLAETPGSGVGPAPRD